MMMSSILMSVAIETSKHFYKAQWMGLQHLRELLGSQALKKNEINE